MTEWKTLSELAEANPFPFEAESDSAGLVCFYGRNRQGDFVGERLPQETPESLGIWLKGCRKWNLAPPPPKKPREWWVSIYRHTSKLAFAMPSREDADADNFGKGGLVEVVRVREILPDSPGVWVTREALERACKVQGICNSCREDLTKELGL